MSGSDGKQTGARGTDCRHRYKKGGRLVEGPMKLSIEQLPEKGLVVKTEGCGAIHRPFMLSSRGEVVPGCNQKRVGPQEAIDGSEIVSEYRVVDIERMLPFGSYSLCENPGCFRHVELVDRDESPDSNSEYLEYRYVVEERADRESGVCKDD